ncbi:CRISPR-associated protein [Mangrovibacterium sp.]|uniref:CRISPR-associated protein n=1 Tax=Mangrovibacterium sp. TaxID=1961364 RepID=UPI0035622A43
MFINLSNHPSNEWTKEQLRAASVWGEILDIPFPSIDPLLNEQEVEILVTAYLSKIRAIRPVDNSIFVIHLMGELTFCFALVARLQQDGIRCVASTTKRETKSGIDGIKQTCFRFIRFRDYLQLTKSTDWVR